MLGWTMARCESEDQGDSCEGAIRKMEETVGWGGENFSAL